MNKDLENIVNDSRIIKICDHFKKLHNFENCMYSDAFEEVGCAYKENGNCNYKVSNPYVQVTLRGMKKE